MYGAREGNCGNSASSKRKAFYPRCTRTCLYDLTEVTSRPVGLRRRPKCASRTQPCQKYNKQVILRYTMCPFVLHCITVPAWRQQRNTIHLMVQQYEVYFSVKGFGPCAHKNAYAAGMKTNSFEHSLGPSFAYAMNGALLFSMHSK